MAREDEKGQNKKGIDARTDFIRLSAYEFCCCLYTLPLNLCRLFRDVVGCS